MFNFEQLNSEWLVAIGIASAAMFVLSLLIVPIVIVRIPDDYFSTRKTEHGLRKGYSSVLHCVITVCKNLLGLLLFLMGIAMLVLPGQGLLTMLLGIVLMDFPGKFSLERRIVSIPKVLKSINWIRSKANRNPLVVTK